MKILKIILILVIFISQLTSSIHSQLAGIHYTDQVTEVNIEEDGSFFTEKSTKKGFNPGKESSIQFIYSELEQFQDLNVSIINKKGKSKKINSNNIIDESLIDYSYYSGYRVKTVKIPALCKFEVSYTKTCSEISLISGFSYSNKNGSDKLDYIVKLGQNYSLAYNIPTSNKDAMITVDSTESTYHFTCVTKKDLTIKKNHDIEPKYVRTLVWNKENSTAWNHLNHWYYNNAKPVNFLSESSIAFFENLTNGITNQDTIAKLVFDYVKKKIIYIDIENGLGAFIPRVPEDTFIKKQGDCKDMANLLVNVLAHFDINAHLALSSSISHPFDLDFPSISSANHVVCAILTNNKWTILDATDNTCYFGNPSTHIQGRNIYIIGENEGILHHIKPIPPANNQAVCSLKIKISDEKINGSLSYSLLGISASKLLYKSDRYSHQQLIEQYTSSLEASIKGMEIENLTIEINRDNATIEGNFNLSDKLLNNYKEKKLLSLSFLPYPHAYSKSIDKNEELEMYQTSLNLYSVALEFDNPVQLTSPKEISAEFDEMKYSFTIHRPSPSNIQIEYKLELDKMTIDENCRLDFNNLNQTIIKTLSETLTYENL
jgi:hypothetical protein